jgi:hypothetical protein
MLRAICSTSARAVRALPLCTTSELAHPASLTGFAGDRLYRSFHATAPADSMLLVGAGLSIAAAAVGASYMLRAADTKAKVDKLTNPGAEGPDATAAKKPAGDQPKTSTPSSAGGMFSAQAMARRFYRGGFEERMTRREAALILGVR